MKKNASLYDKVIFIADKLSWDKTLALELNHMLKNENEESLNKACYLYLKYQFDNNLLVMPHQWILEAYDDLRKEKNELSQQVGALMKEKKVDEANEVKAKVVASINEGAISSQVDVTCEEIPPIIEAGTYKLHHTRGGVTYYMAKGPTETSYPIPVTDEDDAQILEFVTVAGKKDTFLIKTAEEEPVYLCVKDFTKNQLFFGTSEEADEWVVAEGTKEAGQYDIYTEEGATKRFISMYEKDEVVTDFRTYNSATGTNRKENSDLTAVAQKHITGIAITNPPSKLEYKQGEEINLAGLVVTASYSDADPEVVEGYEVSPRVFNEAGTITVTVTYKGQEATFDVTVSERKLASIAVDGDMTKKEYENAAKKTGLITEGKYEQK